MSKTIYGDAFIALHLTCIDCGEPEDLHDICDWSVDHGAKKVKISHPLNIHQRVLNGLDRDERFKKTYIKYRGIYNKSVRHFRLKEKYDVTEGERPYLVDQGVGNRLVQYKACRMERPGIFGYGMSERLAIHDLVHNVQPLWDENDELIV
jgi:hypothetical protein